MGSEVWETMPALTYGEFEYEKLQVLDWNSGRCEATSFDTMAETENGYYMSLGFPVFLYYADKTNLDTWLPACGDSDCLHNSDSCNAYIQYQEFVIRNDRIHYQLTQGIAAELYDGGANMILVSMAADGSGKKFEYAFDQYAPATTSSYMSFLNSQHYLYSVVEMTSDGIQIAHSYRLTDEGAEKVATVENFEGMCLLQSARGIPIYGDKLLYNGVTAESMKTYCRYSGDALEQIDVTDFPRYSYLSDDTLRFFRINDGYYDVNIKTGEEIKLADSQLENSNASIVLPNCIIESTLMAYLIENNADYYVEGTTHEMRLFDGESWRSVKLPEELLNAGAYAPVRVKAVTSDCILFIFVDMAVSNQIAHYYCVDLTADELALEYFYTY